MNTKVLMVSLLSALMAMVSGVMVADGTSRNK